MNLEEAIEKLKRFNCEECSFVACEQCEINYEEVQAIKTVLAEIDRLKADLYSANTIIDDLVGTKWISVNDRLPEEETKVLVCRDWQCIEIGYVYGEDWFTWENNEIINFATHWAELPELPKEENSDI